MLETLQTWANNLVSSFLGLSTFTQAASVASVAFLFLLIQTFRARKPLQLPPLKSDKEPNAVFKHLGLRTIKWIGQVIGDLLFLSKQSEDLYKEPRVLLIGEHNSGKSSLASTLESSDQIRSLLEKAPDDRHKQGWWKFEQGMLIDFEGLINKSSRKEVIDELVRARPERPIDAVVTCISAEELAGGNAKEIGDRAIAVYDNLSKLQQELSFTFPVYLIITKLDLVEGFSHFWLEQDQKNGAKRLREIFGWSNPSSLESGYSDTWPDAAFDQMEESLRFEQLRIAASAESRTDNGLDDFFLFPARFAELRKPLREMLDRIFKVNAYQANFFFRGIYFSGKVISPEQRDLSFAEALEAAPVSFVENLFSTKIFAEKHLARPIREGVWSRQEQIRRLQKIALGAAVVLLFSLALSSLLLNSRVSNIETLAARLDYERDHHDNQSGQGCADLELISSTLQSLGNLTSGLGSFFMPLSWAASSLDKSLTEFSETVLNGVVVKGIDCQLQLEGQEIVNSTAPSPSQSQPVKATTEMLSFTNNYLSQMEKLDASLSTWSQFVESSSGEDKYRQLNDLFETLYDKSLPSIVRKERVELIDIFNAADLGADTKSDTVDEEITDGLSTHVTQLARQTSNAFESGKQLITVVNDKKMTLDQATEFSIWVSWINEEWVPENSPAESTDCEQIRTLLNNELVQLGDLKDTDTANFVSELMSSGCSSTSQQELKGQSISPLGSMLVSGATDGSSGSWMVSKAWQDEASNLKALSALGFMQRSEQIQSTAAMTCPLGNAVRWDTADLSQMQQYMEQLASFDFSGQAKDGTDTPSESFARTQLAKVLNFLIVDAQKSSYSTPQYANSITEDVLVAANKDFASALPLINQILGQYQSLDMSEEGQEFADCVYQFANKQLGNIQTYMNTSAVLKPTENPKADTDNQATMLLFGQSGDFDTWWKTKSAKAKDLIGYSAPYLQLFQSNLDVYPLKNEKPDYDWWTNTANAASNYDNDIVPNQETNLETLFSDLTGLTEQSCSTILTNLQTPTLGIDFFSDRSRTYINNADTFCESSITRSGQSIYDQLDTSFDALAGKFPFASSSTGSEATLNNTRNFFLNYAAEADTLSQYLNSEQGNVNAASNKLLLNQFSDAVQFFNSHLAVEGTPESLNIKVTFRPDSDDSTNSSDPDGAEDVVVWMLTDGLDSAKRPPGGDSITWFYGQPLTFSFQWASDANFEPVADSSQPGLNVDTTTRIASFSYSGSWALQKVLANHWYSGPAVGTTAPKTVRLRFEIPVQRTDKTASNNSDKATASPEKVALYADIDVTTTSSAGQVTSVFIPQQLPQAFPKTSN